MKMSRIKALTVAIFAAAAVLTLNTDVYAKGGDAVLARPSVNGQLAIG